MNLVLDVVPPSAFSPGRTGIGNVLCAATWRPLASVIVYVSLVRVTWHARATGAERSDALALLLAAANGRVISHRFART